MSARCSQSRTNPLSIALILLALVSGSIESSVSNSGPVKRLRSGFDQPSDIAVSEKGRIFLLDGSHHRVVVLSPQGRRELTFGREGADAGQLKSPMAIAIEGDRVYIADTGNHRIAEFNLQGRFIRNIPLLSEAESDAAEPVGLLVRDEIAVWSDRRNHRVCRSDLRHKAPARCWGNRGDGETSFQFPFHLANDRDGYLHVVDVLNGRVQVFNRKGRFFTQISRFGIETGELYRPNGIAFADDGRMFVSDSYRGTVSVFTDGRFSGLLSIDGRSARKFKVPVGLAWNKGRLYVVEALGNAVEVIESAPGDKGILPQEKLAQRSGKSSRKNCDICHFSWAEPDYDTQKETPKVLPVASPEMCYSCHHGAVIDSRTAIGRGSQHPDIHHQRDKAGSQVNERQDEIAGEFPLLENEQLYCGSCHTPHTTEINEADTLYESHANPWLRVLNKEGDLCQKCHQSKLDSTQDEKHPPTGVNHPVGIYLSPPPGESEKGFAKSEKLQNGLPGELKNAGGSLGSKQQMLCQSCHQIHGANGEQLLLTGFEKNELCASCHESKHSKDKKEARKKGIHPVNIDMEEAVELGDRKVKQVTCLVCHSAHDGREESPLLTRSTEQLEQLCAACHSRHHASDEDEARQKGVHAVNMELEEPVEMGEEKISKVTCLSCHSVHQGKQDTPALRFVHKSGELCNYCHEAKDQVINTDHDLRITADQNLNKFEQTPLQSGVCGSCHSMHRAEGKAAFLFAGETFVHQGEEEVLQRDQLCLNCHRDKGVAKESFVKHFSHPSKDLILRSDPYVLPLLDEDEEISEFGTIACITCHDPHHWEADSTTSIEGNTKKAKNRAGNVLNSFLRLKEIKKSFCVDCHGIETRLKYKYYHDKLSRDARIDYIK